MTKRTSSARSTTLAKKPTKSVKPSKTAPGRAQGVKSYKGAPTTKGRTAAVPSPKLAEAQPLEPAAVANDAGVHPPSAPGVSARARALVLDEPDLKKAVAALQKFGATELQRLFQELFDGETRSTSLVFLRKAIAKGLHERAGGQPPAQPEAESRSAQRRQVAAPGERDPRLPPAGTVIERVYKGEALRVKVLEEGFSFKGTTFPSLSALAKTFTKCSTNGFLWFGLAQRPERSPSSAEVQG